MWVSAERESLSCRFLLRKMKNSFEKQKNGTFVPRVFVNPLMVVIADVLSFEKYDFYFTF